MVGVLSPESPRTPQPGDALILPDGRRFVLTEAGAGLRGWWFKATAQDGCCRLQGNLDLEWDSRVRAWQVGRSISRPRTRGTRPSPSKIKHES